MNAEELENNGTRMINTIKRKKIWVAVCGDIRLEFELYLILNKVTALRDKGLIDGIVVSTWNGSADKIPGLRTLLNETGIALIESDPVDQLLEDYTHMSFLRQAVQLQAAIEVIPDDVFLLRCRTDFSYTTVNNIVDCLTNQVRVQNDSVGILKYKLIVDEISISLPFVFKDISFYGYIEDIDKMILLDLTKYTKKQLLMADFSFFLNPFLKRITYLDDFYKKVNYIELKKLLEKLDEKSISDFPTALVNLFALYFDIIRKNILCHPEYDIDEQLNLDDLLLRRKYVLKRWHLVLPTTNIIESVLNNKNSSSKLQTRFIDATKKIPYMISNGLSKQEVNELRSWTLYHYKIDIVKTRNKIEENPFGINIKTALQKMHPEFAEQIEIVNEIQQENKRIEDCFVSCYTQCGEELKKKIIPSMIRYIGWDKNVLKILANAITRGLCDDNSIANTKKILAKYLDSLLNQTCPTTIASLYLILKSIGNAEMSTCTEAYLYNVRRYLEENCEEAPETLNDFKETLSRNMKKRPMGYSNEIMNELHLIVNI